MQNVLTPPPSAPVQPTAPAAFAPSPIRPGETPLLPPLLMAPAALLWCWVLPIGVLLALNLQGYGLIEGNMSADERLRAWWVGAANLGNLLLGVGLYVAARRLAVRGTSAAGLLVRTVPALAVQIGYLCLAHVSSDMIPFSVRGWIYPESRFLFNQFSFAMLPLFFGVLHLACAPWGGRHARVVAANAGVTMAVPILLFLLLHGTKSFRQEFVLPAVIVATMVVGAGVALLVGVIRAMMVGLRGTEPRAESGRERIAVVIVSLVLPLGGLLLNRAIPFPVDFQTWEVYALTLLNFAVLSVVGSPGTELEFAL